MTTPDTTELTEASAGGVLKVTGETVTFVLTAPTLDERLARIIGDIAAHLTEATGIEPLWVP